MVDEIDRIRNLEKLRETFGNVSKELEKVIVGQKEVVEQILVALLCNSNALLESNPGLGKTLMIKTISKILDLKFSRIQFTPDLMPSDITGTYLIDDMQGRKEFRFEKGPIFANIVLADEINRATPKTQSALLEAMEERQVTAGNKTHKLDEPFFVLATQNPIEQEGTYPLPEAQQDRFLLKIKLDYPTFEDELKIVERFTKEELDIHINTLLGQRSILLLQKLSRQVPIANDIKRRAVEIVLETRNNKELIEYGASPRASIGLVMAAKAKALIDGRKYVSETDVLDMSYPLLRHRIIPSFEAERRGMSPDDIIAKVIRDKRYQKDD